MKATTRHTTERHDRRLGAPPRRRPVNVPPPMDGLDLTELPFRPWAGATLTGGDVDADWARAWDSGDEAVGGSVATPDQDIVDEIGHALGVEQAPDAEVWTSREILRERDLHRWEQEE